MKGLFIFTAGDSKAREHLSDSITNRVSSNLLREHLSQQQADTILSTLPEPSGFFAWGAVPGKRNFPMWSAMKTGDIVLTVYDNHYRYASSILSKIHSPSLAKAIWGSDTNGKTWEYMYLLTEPIKIEAHVLSTPFVDYLNRGYRGFTQISSQRLQHIRQDYGSLDNFLERTFIVAPVEAMVDKLLKQASETTSDFNPTSIMDGRKKTFAEVVRRQGQPRFRSELLDAYGCCCAITDCDVVSVLEAAHIIPYAGPDTNNVSNGLLLRADIHTLFDLGEIKVDGNYVIHVSERLIQSTYGALHGKRIRLPSDKSKKPHVKALEMKFSLSL